MDAFSKESKKHAGFALGKTLVSKQTVKGLYKINQTLML